MPNYKDGTLFNQLPNDANFDTIHMPGQLAPFSGIYKCVGCGFEAVSRSGDHLPPQVNCSQHAARWPNVYGEVRWKLAAAAIHIRLNA
jgi:hypothetical protein